MRPSLICAFTQSFWQICPATSQITSFMLFERHPLHQGGCICSACELSRLTYDLHERLDGVDRRFGRLDRHIQALFSPPTVTQICTSSAEADTSGHSNYTGDTVCGTCGKAFVNESPTCPNPSHPPTSQQLLRFNQTRSRQTFIQSFFKPPSN